MNRASLQLAITQDFGYADTPAAAVSTRIQGYLNDRHRRILARQGLEKLREQTATIATVASTPTYSLDLPIEKVLKLSDQTNNYPLYERSLDWYRQMDPDQSVHSGTPQYWINMGLNAALRDISITTGSGLWVVSTSATDTTQTVHVETIDANGAMTSATATVNGLTRVVIGAATNHMRLVRFSISAVGVGNIELYDAVAAGNKVSYIGLSRTSAQFQKLAIWPTPGGAYTLYLDYLQQIRDFVVAYDEPQLPLDYHWLLRVGASIDEARKKGEKGDDRIKDWVHEYEQGLAQLINFVENGPDTLFIPGRIQNDFDHGSNLGSFFPSGRWT